MAVALAPARQASRRAPARRPTRAAQPSGLHLPVSTRAMQSVLRWLLIALMLVALGVLITTLRLPQRAADWALQSSARAGLVIDHVEVTGAQHIDPAQVKAIVLEGADPAILGLDLSDVRARLLRLDWVRDASVARRLPDRIDISIRERTPAALYRSGGRTLVIDATGRALGVPNLAPYTGLMLLAGPGAPGEFASLKALLATQPDLSRQVDAAAWVGGRRWDLKLKSGETIALPEGYANAQTALADFLTLNTRQTLIGRGFVRFDLRLAGKLVVRRPALAPARQGGLPV